MESDAVFVDRFWRWSWYWNSNRNGKQKGQATPATGQLNNGKVNSGVIKLRRGKTKHRIDLAAVR